MQPLCLSPMPIHIHCLALSYSCAFVCVSVSVCSSFISIQNLVPCLQSYQKCAFTRCDCHLDDDDDNDNAKACLCKLSGCCWTTCFINALPFQITIWRHGKRCCYFNYWAYLPFYHLKNFNQWMFVGSSSVRLWRKSITKHFRDFIRMFFFSYHTSVYLSHSEE